MPTFAPILTSVEARRLLQGLEGGAASVSVSLDLGLSQAELAVVDGTVRIGGDAVAPETLCRIAEDGGKCFEIANGAAVPLAIFSERTGWLRSLSPTVEAPTTLVAGFAMHRTVGTTPMADTRTKIRALGRPRGRALDTATGLGYTAIELAKTCTEVVTVELDPAAIELARRNPWSARLFESAKIELMTGDVGDLVRSFGDGEFTLVLHDPPTLQLAGELYSGAFYAELMRVLKPGGKLFHYVGDPASGAGRRTVHGVVRRLTAAGFVHVRIDRRAFGVTALAGFGRGSRNQRSRSPRRAPSNPRRAPSKRTRG